MTTSCNRMNEVIIYFYKRKRQYNLFRMNFESSLTDLREDSYMDLEGFPTSANPYKPQKVDVQHSSVL